MSKVHETYHNKVQISFELIPASSQTFKSLHPRRDPIKNSTFTKKDAAGRVRRYIVGTSSGLLKDAHDESMTERCVKGFMQQAKEKTILLVHPHTDNLLDNQIGKLDDEQSFIDKDTEWKTVFRLWDKYDLEDNSNFNEAYVKKANNFWAMTRGEAPYGKPTRICQFSIQGLLDEKDVIKADNGRNLDWIEIDAVAAVTRGAYPQEDYSAVEKIFKQFDVAITIPRKIEKGELTDLLAEKDRERDYYNDMWDIESAYRDKQREVLESKDDPESKKARITQLLDEYKELSLNLLATYNFSLPGSEENSADSAAKGEEPVKTKETDPKEDKNKAEELKPEDKTKGEGDPPTDDGTQDKNKDDGNSAIAESLMSAAKLIADAAQALAGKKDDGTETEIDNATKGDGGETEDEDKTKKKDAVSDMEGANRDEDVNKTVKEISIRLEKMGLPKSEIDKVIADVKRKSNPMIGVQGEITSLRTQIANQEKMFKSLLVGIEELASGKGIPAGGGGQVNKSDATRGNGPSGDVNILESAMVEDLKKKGYKIEKDGVKKGDDKTNTSQPSSLSELRKTLQESYKGGNQ